MCGLVYGDLVGRITASYNLTNGYYGGYVLASTPPSMDGGLE